MAHQARLLRYVRFCLRSRSNSGNRATSAPSHTLSPGASFRPPGRFASIREITKHAPSPARMTLPEPAPPTAVRQARMSAPRAACAHSDIARRSYVRGRSPDNDGQLRFRRRSEVVPRGQRRRPWLQSSFVSTRRKQRRPQYSPMFESRSTLRWLSIDKSMRFLLCPNVIRQLPMRIESLLTA